MHPTHSTVGHDTGTATPRLPELDPGLRLLAIEPDATRSDDQRSVSTAVLHTLVLDHLLIQGGTVQWVDAGGHASTRPLVRLAPSERSLERIHVGRAFTPYQHLALLERLTHHVDNGTSLVVCPALDLPYRDSDCSRDAERLLLRALSLVAGIARDHDVPVLMTRAGGDAFAEPIDTAATERIEYRETRHGPRFVGEAFETLVYPTGDGFVQTTLAFWQQTLEARTPLYNAAETGLLAEA